MSATALKAAAIAYVRTLFTNQEVVQVNSYGGEFSEAELGAKSFVCPAIFITAVGWHPEPAGPRLAGRHCMRVYMLGFVLTKSSDRETRAAQALAIAERMANGLRDWLPDNTDPTCVISALDEQPSAENLYTRSLDSQGVARWMVKWDQTVKPLPTAKGTLQPLQGVDIKDIVHTGGDPDPVVITPVPVTEEVTFDSNPL